MDRTLPENRPLDVMADGDSPRSDGSQTGEPCWNAPEGAVCRFGRHWTRDGALLPCRRRPVEKAIKDHRALLAACKFLRSQGPVTEPLRDALDPTRDVSVAVDASGTWLHGVEVVEELVRQLPEVTRRHALRHGSRGVGKTHHALIEYFWCVENGVASVWLAEPDFLELVCLRRSTVPSEREQAQKEWKRLVRAQVVFLDDLCMDENPPRQRQPGRPLLQVSLVELLSSMDGVLRVTTNRDLKELNEHPDCGGRALSRLLGPHQGEPAQVWCYEGEDQRVWESVRTAAQRSRAPAVARP